MGVAPLVVQLRTAQAGAQAALLAAPGGDLFMVAPQQHSGHGAPLPDFRTGVLRVLQQTIPVAFLLIAFLLGQHTGLQPQHTVGHHQAGQLAAGEDVISNGDLFIRKASMTRSSMPS